MHRFQPGNKAGKGRIKGSKNKPKKGNNLRNGLVKLAEKNLPKLRRIMDELEGEKFINAFCKIAPYVLPQLQAMAVQVKPGDMNMQDQQDLFFQIVNTQTQLNERFVKEARPVKPVRLAAHPEGMGEAIGRPEDGQGDAIRLHEGPTDNDPHVDG